jgi:hypothetical protein
VFKNCDSLPSCITSAVQILTASRKDICLVICNSVLALKVSVSMLSSHIRTHMS